MNNPPSRWCRIAWFALGAVGLPVAQATAEEAATPKPPVEPKTHVLYMGADLSVQQGKRFYQVQDIDGSEFVVTVDGKKQFVRTRLQSNNIKVNRELKLSAIAVELDNMQGAAGYTPANDPNLRFAARTGAASGAKAANEVATYQAEETANTLAVIRNAPIRLPDMEKALENNLDIQQNQAAVSGYQLQSDYASIPSQAGELAKELAEGNYDMVDVSFKISSPVPLDDPYMVVLVEFQTRGAKPGDVSLLIHGEGLEPITSKPKYIRIREGGMPIGFKFLRHEVHIYNRGKEVATNASSKRVELNRDEAHQYVLMEYLAANKDATRPASALPGSLTPAARTRLSGQQLQTTCYVKVGADGTMLGVFRDEAANFQLGDEELKAVLADAFFKPALVKGKPVEGVARVRPADLAL